MKRSAIFPLVLSLVGAANAARAEVIDCVIEPRRIVSVSSEAEGLVTEVMVQRGQVVEQGQAILQLDNRIEALQLKLAEEIAGSDIALRSERERLAFRKKELARVEQLRDRNVTAESALDDARIEVRLSELAVDEALFALQRARIEADLAQAQLDRRTLNAPLAGTVISVETAPGEYADTQDELLQIADLDPLYVEVFMPAEYYERISEGMTFSVSLIAPLSGRHPATVSVIDRVFDAASGTFGMRLVLENPDKAIPAGVRCQLDITPS